MATSLKQSINSATVTSVSVQSDDNIIEEVFTPLDDGRYKQYREYKDENYSLIDEYKSISVNNKQVNITQEKNSQYIPFRIKRFYDGIDLLNMVIQIHFQNANKQDGVSDAVNVAYSDNYLQFGWLVDENATALKGDLKFEIVASGTNEKGEEYLWKSKPDGKLNIIESLSSSGGVIQPDDSWYTTFLNTATQKVAEAQQAAEEAKVAAEQAKQAAAGVDTDTLKTEIKELVMEDIDASIAESYYNKSEVDKFIADLDTAISGIDSLANLNVEYDSVSGALTFKDGTDLIATVSINSLSNLSVTYTVSEGKGMLHFFNGSEEITSVEVGSTDPSEEWTATLRSSITEEINEAVANLNIPEIDQLTSDVAANKSAISTMNEKVSEMENTVSENNNTVSTLSNTVATMKSDVDAHTADISGLNMGLSDVESKVNGMTSVKSNEYDITYDESILTLYENEEIKTQVTITGGSGGQSSSVVKIERITPTTSVSLSGKTVEIKYTFSSLDSVGDDTGNGTAVWTVGNTKVATSVAQQGENSFDITQYLNVGANTIKVAVTDSYGNLATKQWTVTIIDFYISSIFDDALFYSGDVLFRYTPYGDIEKTIHFELDGIEIGSYTTSVTGRQLTQTISSQEHGSHLLKVYMTATINSEDVVSDPVYKDIMWIDTSNETPVIGCSMAAFTAKQYNTTAINYVVYDPQNNPASVTLAVDDEVVSTLSVDRTSHVWSYKSSDIGEHTLTITCGSTVKTITATIEDLGIIIEPVTTNLVFDFNPAGRSNADENRDWTDGTYSMAVSDNFDWSNGGYQIDSDGDTYFCVKAGTTATLDYRLFADDTKKTGKNFKFIYKCTNVKDYDAQVLSCLNSGIGYVVQAQNVKLSSEQNYIEVPAVEDRYIEMELNILPDSQYREMNLWTNAIPSRGKPYVASDNFTQPSPTVITIGSDDCDVWVYRMKAYTINLTDDEILDNFIADAKNADEMIDRYMRNQILNASGSLDPDIIAEKHPDLRVVKVECPHFAVDKKAVPDTTVQHIYKNGRSEDNWTATGSHKGQGTSSIAYIESALNIDIDCSGGFTFGDGSTGSKYAMTENSVPEKYFNMKVNVASSENANNSCLADDHNTYNPHIRAAKIADPRVRNTMEFHPCVIFIRETDTENATVFPDGQWHFYACGDFGNSKKNSDAMGMDPENHKEFIVEILNNTDDQARFLSDDLSSEDWSGDYTFEFRYSNPDCTEEELQAGKDAWQRVLSWVVNATPETFVAEFEDYFIKDSVLFNYLFTERHLMIDNRSKNTFWHTEDLIHWDADFDYDNDTAQGNNNTGGLTFTYGMEDTDQLGDGYVFNAYDSKLWCYVRDYMYDDLKELYNRPTMAECWNSNRIIAKYEAYQNMKPERLWIADMRRKYYRTYEDNGTTSYLEMMHGKKELKLVQFETYQDPYIDSKYMGSKCVSDAITIRGYTPTEWSGVEPSGDLRITPYADIYITVKYGTGYIVHKRAKRNTEYLIESPIPYMNDTEVYPYSASMLKSIGDVSGFYPRILYMDNGIKMTDIHVGSSADGYKNNNMTEFTVNNNILLEHLNIQNTPNLKQSLSLANCANLEDLYAEGSGITGVIFAKGGKISIAHLPAIASLTANNLQFLTDLTFEGYDNFTTVSIDNCPTIDTLDLVTQASGLQRVRITGIDWELENTDILDRLAKLTGLDENGYNTSVSVLEGKVHVTVMRQQNLLQYNSIWPNLEITYDTIIEQYKVTFVNDDADNTVLDIQYVDKGGSAVDPITRSENPIDTPTKESTVSTDFTYYGWDGLLTGIFADRTLTAVYTESVRQYTAKYVSKGVVKKEVTAPYGSYVYYDGDIPVYTSEESAYKYNLFSRWDKSGLITGDKTINAVFDTCEYTEGYFDGKDLGSLKPVEIYAAMKLGLESSLFEVKDSFDLPFGVDYTYDDVEEHEVVSATTKFDGSNYIDTGIQIMKEDRAFTVAIDFEFASGNSTNSVLAQCFQSDGSNGFRLWYNSGVKLSWGTDSITPASGTNREIVVFRHEAGSNKIQVFVSNLSGDDITAQELTATRNPVIDSTLVLGCAKADDGYFENYAKGSVHWCKVWYADLGEGLCSNLAQWIHETIPMELAKLRAYYLSNVSSKRAPLTFLAGNVLSIKKAFSNKSTNEGGWADSTLNTWMNTRLPKAISPQWASLIKQVKVISSIGNKSLETSTSNCYFFAPSIYELDNSLNMDPYVSETNATISYMTTNTIRKRTKVSDPETGIDYWTRSPNIDYSNYIYTINTDGQNYGFSYPTYSAGVLLMFCMAVE